MVKATVRVTVKHMRQVRWSRRNIIIMFAAYILFFFDMMLTGLLVLAKIGGAEVGMLPINLIVLLILGAFMIHRTFFYEKTMLKHYEHTYPNTTADYSFGENGFTLEERGDNHSLRQEFEYGALLQVVEKKDWFVIYVTAMTIYVVNKSEITEGTPEELRLLMKNALGNKYKDLS